MGDSVAGNRVFRGANPFDVDPHHYDQIATPDPGDPDWSETHFWSVWNAAAGVGLFIHVGTDTEDKELWWYKGLCISARQHGGRRSLMGSQPGPGRTHHR